MIFLISDLHVLVIFEMTIIILNFDKIRPYDLNPINFFFF